MKLNSLENNYPEDYRILRLVFETPERAPQEFVELMNKEEYKKGEFLQNDFHQLVDLIYVVEGSVRVFEQTEGVERVHRLLGKGDVFYDYSSCGRSSENRLIVQFSSRSIVYRMRYELLVAATMDSVVVREFLIQLASKMLFEEIEHRSLLSGVEAITRINVVKSLFPHLITRFTQRDLSSYLGMAVESYNRLYHQI
jgi:CRP-like cAMP-binding protein